MGQPRRPTTPPARDSQDGPLPLRGSGRPQGSPSLAQGATSPPQVGPALRTIYLSSVKPHSRSVPHPSPLPALPLASRPLAPGAERGREPTTHATVLPMFSPAAQQPTKRYRTIVADPPWPFTRTLPERGGGHWLYRADRENRVRTSAARYGLMQIEELMNLPIGLWAQENAHLYLWTTNAFMAEAHQVAKAWGFEPKTILTWVKPRLGMGTYFRNNTEHVIFAVRGSCPVLRHDVRTAFTGAQGAHSEKPDVFYDIVQSMSLGPYLDVFARKQRFGWDTWGDEAFDFRTDGIWHGGSDA